VNTPLRRLAGVVLLMFVVLLGSATWVQYVQANRLDNDPRNVRTLYREFGNARGPIVVGGTAVASSVKVGGPFAYQRQYAAGPEYSALTGFYSIVNGRTQLEQAENDALTGRGDRLFFSRVRDMLTGRQPEGAAVETTINPAAQDAAFRALGNQQGAVVAIEPSTGKILALVSTPGFDPNELASHDTAAASAAFTRLAGADGNPLRSNATLETYPPGSTFKLVTAATALETGQYTPDTMVASPRVLQLPGSTATLQNFGGETCGGDQVTLQHALTISCNTAFANLGLTLGDAAIKAQAEKFGFNSPLTIPMNVVRSVFPAGLDQPQTAQSAIGQRDVRSTPIQEAMVAAAIANGGVLMKPYVVDTIRAADLSVASKNQPSVMSRAISKQTADQLTSMMVDVVNNGTGTAARIPGVQVAGKTGTAQTADGKAPHAWFTAFAPATDPKVAVAVIVEHGGNLGNEATGGQVAAPIAKAVIQAVLGS
jgi:penicillin-binding protein A